jgi:GWxTD domain-containing protein
MKKIITSLALIIALATSAGAQMSSQDSRVYFDFGEQFYSGASQSPDNKFVDIRLNTASAMFSFVRSNSKKDIARGAYYAIRDVTIELNEKGVVMPVITKGFKDTIFVPSYELTTSKNTWHAMNERIALPVLDRNKEYSMRLEVRDAVLGKLAARSMTLDFKPRWFDPLAMDSTRIGIGDVQLVASRTGDEVVLESRGLNYPFSRTIQGSYVLAVPVGMNLDDLSAEITLRQHTNLINPSDTGERARITLRRADLHPMTSYEIAREDSQIVLRTSTAPSDTMGGGQYQLAVLDFAIPGETFDQGGYRAYLTVTTNGVQRSSSNAINLRWKNMPVSLEDPRDAIAPMIHILTEDQYKDMMSGDRTQQFKKLFTYWKAQDPTPFTAYNEKLAAFYQRVDYAYFNFASGRILDGALTDRGKIYILYGPPTKTERRLLPGEAPTEVWTYTNNVQREFSFTDPSAKGDYKLVAMKNL